MKTFDIAVIGGGITGLGVARAATRRGLSTVLFEAGRCAGQTSNNTLRIMHGGFRYLQQLNLLRVARSLRDQTELLRELPAVIRPLPCLMPLTRWGLKSAPPAAAAALLYRACLTLTGSPLPAPRIVGADFVRARVPALAERAPHGALLWWDATMVDPDRVRDHLIGTLISAGATILEHTPIAAVHPLAGPGGAGATGYHVESCAGERWRAQWVVNTLGPWVDTIEPPEPPAAPSGAQSERGWCIGFNLLTSSQLDPEYAFGVQGSDGRLFFTVPRGSGSAIGTWYIPAAGPARGQPERPELSAAEVAAAAAEFNQAYGAQQLTPPSVIGHEAGHLPQSPHHPTPTPSSTDLIQHQHGYTTVIAAKYTTFRGVGERVVAGLKK